MEKTLPLAAPQSLGAPRDRKRRSAKVLRTTVGIGLILFIAWSWLAPGFVGRWLPLRKHEHDRHHHHHHHHHHHGPSASRCVQPPALFPANNSAALQRMTDFLSSPAFQNASILRLSGAVQVRTESFDDLGIIGEDPRWDVFYGFHDYLQAQFPLIHETLQVELVNTHGLLYTWAGMDSTLKPIVLMAHQDVVPVPDDTVDSWTYPPFSGHFDGDRIWGRGASDCKNTLIAAMEAVELLIDAGFQPQRSIVLSFGFDEECSGTQGAGQLAPFLMERYGREGVAAIVDEGSSYEEFFGRGFAAPGVAEKGYTDVNIVVRTPGGHSSIPSDHTSIGILSEIITAIEAEHYRTYLADNNPILGFLGCAADHAPDFPKKLRKLLDHRTSSRHHQCSAKPDKLAIEAAKLGPGIRYLMQTSQATDLIHGGIKVNALPETATATINHRINIGDRPETVWDHMTAVIAPIATKYNLTLHAFDGTSEAYRAISLSARGNVLPVAPITPTEVDAATPWTVLAGTIRALFGEDTVVAPAIMTGNTDTRYYWDLTRHIFRFSPGGINEPESGLGKIHTVDESIRVSNHFKAVRWYSLFLRNIDAAEI